MKWSPGSYTDLVLSPRWFVTPELQIAVDYRRYHRGQDSYALTSDYLQDVYPVDASVLDAETEVHLTEAAVGLRYSTIASWRDGTAGTPIELGVRLVRAVGGSGGQVPDATRAQLTVSVFRRLWGGAPKAPPPAKAEPGL